MSVTGVPHATVISIGDEYTSSVELYDVTITIAEVLRGAPAWRFLQQSDPGNRIPPAGSEYLLIRIRFDYQARSAPGDKRYELRETQFRAIADEGDIDGPIEHLTLPETLNGALKAPATEYGWIAFIVDPAKRDLQLVFNEDTGNTMHRGSGLWIPLLRQADPSAN